MTFQFSTATVADTFVLPLSAVVNDPDGVYVYIVESTGENGEAVVTRRPVELGELIQDGVEVVAGLAPGDDVVTAGVSVIRDGQRVLVRR